MSEFYTFFQIGIKHVLDLNGYDHVLFLMVLSCTATFATWKRVLVLATFFTVGHTLSLLLSVFGIILVKTYYIELLIPITILATAVHNIFTVKKTTKNNGIGVVGTITILFGIVHGLGFSNYFKNLLSGTFTEKLAPTLSFSAGIEAAQIAVVLSVLVLAYILQNIFKIYKRDFVLVLSAIAVGIVIPMILERF
jgi:hypothetical protein